MVPTKIFLTKGVGRHREKLSSFEEALRMAGISELNLVRVSSIFPPGCKIVPKNEGRKLLKQGQVTYCVMADSSSNLGGLLISASIGLAIPNDRTKHGYLSEHHGHGLTMKASGDYAEDLAASMLATILGMDDNEDVSYDEKKKLWRLTKMIVKTTNITQSAIGKNGIWTTCVSAAVFAS